MEKNHRFQTSLLIRCQGCGKLTNDIKSKIESQHNKKRTKKYGFKLKFLCSKCYKKQKGDYQ